MIVTMIVMKKFRSCSTGPQWFSRWFDSTGEHVIHQPTERERMTSGRDSNPAVVAYIEQVVAYLEYPTAAPHDDPPKPPTPRSAWMSPRSAPS